ncbi:hypothetical protein KCF3NO3_36850 [Chryseobacterium sp. KCF3-3]
MKPPKSGGFFVFGKLKWLTKPYRFRKKFILQKFLQKNKTGIIKKINRKDVYK